MGAIVTLLPLYPSCSLSCSLYLLVMYPLSLLGAEGADNKRKVPSENPPSTL